MLDVFAEVIAPVLLAALVGGVVVRRLGIPGASISALSFFLFSPALVYTSMSTIELGGTETLGIVVVTAAGTTLTALLGYGASAVLRHDARTRAAVGLTAGMSNSGNLGLPVAALAFGQAGFDVAVVGFVTSAFTVNTVGVAIASSATGSARTAAGSLLRVPSLWAAVVGFGVNLAGLDLPAIVTESAGTLGDAAVPVMLVVLGVQLTPDRSTDGLAEAALGVAVRLLAGPAVAYALAVAVGIDGATRDTLVVLGGLPAAVYTTILATQFDVRPPLVTRTVVVGTLASVLTLTVLIAQYR